MCGVEGCCERAVAHGLCGTHYQFARRNGLIRVKSRERGPLESRFWAKVDKCGPDECWAWLGGKNSKGYGVIQEAGRGSRLLSAHRVSYEIHHGPIDGYVLHSCDTPNCVNPTHLRDGTQSENIREAFAKGRKVQPIAFGEENPRSKLTLVQAQFIKAHPEMKHTELAELFGLSPNCIRGVRIGRTWKDA